MRPIDKRKHTLVLSLIQAFHNYEDKDPSYLDFIVECEMGSHTVTRVLSRLESEGILKIRRGHGCRRNEYTMNGGAQ